MKFFQVKLRNLFDFLSCARGNVAITVALCALPLMAAVTGALEINAMISAKANLQASVDAGALAGAQRLGVVNANGSSDVAAAAITAANSNLGRALAGTPVAYAVSTDMTAGSVTMTGSASHKALIGFLGFGDQVITATATADALGSVPLCVLQTGSDKTDSGIQVKDQAVIRATGCAVHANKNIQVDGGAFVQAARVSAVGQVKGSVSPVGQSGGLAIPDPFSDIDLTPPTTCEGKPTKYKVVKDSVLALPPGVHCEHFDIDTGATLQLLPGDHYFMDDLNAHNNAIIQGDDVALVFGANKKVNFFDHSAVHLSARKTGPFAGFLIITTRTNTQEFDIASDNVSELLGTIYIPSARLVIDTTGKVAEDSAWSIIVADTLQLRHNPSLVINTNYVGSGVPVPTGVGPSQKVSLVK